MGSIFGGSKSKSTSNNYNKAYDFISGAFSPVTEYTGSSASAIADLLRGDTGGFEQFKRATGFDPIAEAGSRAITNNRAAGGQLRSGATGKRLVEYGNNIQQQFTGNYLDRLLGLANLGIGAGGLITSAGQVGQSQQSSRSKPGIGGLIGGISSGIAASDRGLKENVIKIAELANGLGVYMYNYINDKVLQVGVMADEVKRIVPQALGPKIFGYNTVDYSKIDFSELK